MSERIKYKWSWKCLSLFRHTTESTHGSFTIGSTERVFTLKPSWLWQYWQNEFMVAIGRWPREPKEKDFLK